MATYTDSHNSSVGLSSRACRSNPLDSIPCTDFLPSPPRSAHLPTVFPTITSQINSLHLKSCLRLCAWGPSPRHLLQPHPMPFKKQICFPPVLPLSTDRAFDGFQISFTSLISIELPPSRFCETDLQALPPPPPGTDKEIENEQGGVISSRTHTVRKGQSPDPGLLILPPTLEGHETSCFLSLRVASTYTPLRIFFLGNISFKLLSDSMFYCHYRYHLQGKNSRLIEPLL